MIISFAEDGRKVEAGMEPVTPTAAQSSSSSVPANPEQIRLAQLERLQNLIDKALKGELPRDRNLKSWEVDKLNATHVQMIMDRATGMSNNDIAAKYEYSAASVSMILCHPDAQVLLTTILSQAADRLTDVGERLKFLAPEALNVKVEVMRLSKNDSLRDKVASDILSMVGYGGKSATNININSNNRATIQLPAQAAANLVEALKEASVASGMDYSQYLASPTGAEIFAEHRQLSNGLPTEVGRPGSEGGASPSPASPEDVDYTVEERWRGVPEDAEMAQALAEEREAREVA